MNFTPDKVWLMSHGFVELTLINELWVNFGTCKAIGYNRNADRWDIGTRNSANLPWKFKPAESFETESDVVYFLFSQL